MSSRGKTPAMGRNLEGVAGSGSSIHRQGSPASARSRRFDNAANAAPGSSSAVPPSSSYESGDAAAPTMSASSSSDSSYSTSASFVSMAQSFTDLAPALDSVHEDEVVEGDANAAVRRMEESLALRIPDHPYAGLGTSPGSVSASGVSAPLRKANSNSSFNTVGAPSGGGGGGVGSGMHRRPSEGFHTPGSMSRRPSAISALSNHSLSPPTTPIPGPASRNRILASTSAAVHQTTAWPSDLQLPPSHAPNMPTDYGKSDGSARTGRSKNGSRGRDRRPSISSTVSDKRSRRPGTADTATSTPPVPAKDAPASTSAPPVSFPDNSMRPTSSASASASEPPRGFRIRGSSSVGGHHGSSRDEIHRPGSPTTPDEGVEGGRGADAESIASQSSSKPSLRSRIFGLRRNKTAIGPSPTPLEQSARGSSSGSRSSLTLDQDAGAEAASIASSAAEMNRGVPSTPGSISSRWRNRPRSQSKTNGSFLERASSSGSVKDSWIPSFGSRPGTAQSLTTSSAAQSPSAGEAVASSSPSWGSPSKSADASTARTTNARFGDPAPMPTLWGVTSSRTPSVSSRRTALQRPATSPGRQTTSVFPALGGGGGGGSSSVDVIPENATSSAGPSTDSDPRSNASSSYQYTPSSPAPRSRAEIPPEVPSPTPPSPQSGGSRRPSLTRTGTWPADRKAEGIHSGGSPDVGGKTRLPRAVTRTAAAETRSRSNSTTASPDIPADRSFLNFDPAVRPRSLHRRGGSRSQLEMLTSSAPTNDGLAALTSPELVNGKLGAPAELDTGRPARPGHSRQSSSISSRRRSTSLTSSPAGGPPAELESPATRLRRPRTAASNASPSASIDTQSEAGHGGGSSADGPGGLGLSTSGRRKRDSYSSTMTGGSSILGLPSPVPRSSSLRKILTVGGGAAAAAAASASTSSSPDGLVPPAPPRRTSSASPIASFAQLAPSLSPPNTAREQTASPTSPPKPAPAPAPASADRTPRLSNVASKKELFEGRASRASSGGHRSTPSEDLTNTGDSFVPSTSAPGSPVPPLGTFAALRSRFALAAGLSQPSSAAGSTTSSSPKGEQPALGPAPPVPPLPSSVSQIRSPAGTLSGRDSNEVFLSPAGEPCATPKDSATAEVSPISLQTAREIPAEEEPTPAELLAPESLESGEAGLLKADDGKRPSLPPKSPLRLRPSRGSAAAAAPAEPMPIPSPSLQSAELKPARPTASMTPSSSTVQTTVSTPGPRDGADAMQELGISPLRRSIEAAAPHPSLIPSHNNVDMQALFDDLGSDRDPFGSSPGVEPIGMVQAGLASGAAAAGAGSLAAAVAMSNSASSPSAMARRASKSDPPPPLPIKDGVGSAQDDGSGSRLLGRSDWARTLRKVTPPARVLRDDGGGDGVKKKTTKKWRFGAGSKEPTSENESEMGHGAGAGSRLKAGKRSMRARPSEPISRLEIRRVFNPGEDQSEAGHQQQANGCPAGMSGEGELPSRPTIKRMQSGSQGGGARLASQSSAPSLRSRRSLESESSHGRFADQSLTHGTASPMSPSTALRTFGGNGAAPGTPGTPGSENLSAEARRVHKRRNVISELIETEKSYAADLAVIRDIYLSRARQRIGISGSGTTLFGASPASGMPPGHSPISGISTPASASSSSAFLPQRPGLTSASSLRPSFLSSASSDALDQQQQQQQPQQGGVGGVPQSSTSLQAHLRMPKASAAGASLSTATSTASSNRSSVHTVSSQTSASEASPVPPMPSQLPGTPPIGSSGASLLSASGSEPTLNSLSASSSISGTTVLGELGLLGSPASSMSVTGRARPPPLSTTGLTSSTSSILLSQSATVMPDAPFTTADVRIIFAHLEQCAAFADEMAARLEGAMGSQPPLTGNEDPEHEDDTIGTAFVQLMPRIEQVYTAYCSRHEASITRLQELCVASTKAAAFFRECTEDARPYTNAWDLASLLIKPVQRVLKYPLLIQQILGTTRRQHPDYEMLLSAQDKIQKVAETINEVKKRKDLVGTIITGKGTTRMATSKSQVSSSSKRFLRSKSEKVKQTVMGASLDPTSEEYPRLVAQFSQLDKGVARFARECLDWSIALKEAYKAERSLLKQLLVVYDLTPQVPASEAATASARAQDRVKVLCSLLRDRVLRLHWTQLDGDLRATILPMAQRIGAMFESPRMVMAKRDEHELDYNRYRALTRKGDKAPDRKLVESVNAFLALHGQLLDELPQFNYGVQTLLDVAVHALARLQAAHFAQVRDCLLEFWTAHARDAASELGHPPTFRNAHPLRIFYSAHQGPSEMLRALGHARQEMSREMGIGATTPSEPATPASQSVDIDQATDLDNDASTTNSHGRPSLLALPNKPRGVAGALMRSLSGTFSKDHSPADEQPPSITGSAAATDTEPSEVPLLPTLSFKSKGRDSWFVLNGSSQTGLPFLDNAEHPSAPTKEEYDLSPRPQHARLMGGVRPSSSGSSRSSLLNQANGASAAVSAAAAAASKNQHSRATSSTSVGSSSGEGRRQMRVLETLIAIQPSPPRDPAGRMGWPWLVVRKGDEIKVLSYDHLNPELSLVFGRGADGVLGWAERTLLVPAERPSSGVAASSNNSVH